MDVAIVTVASHYLYKVHQTKYTALSIIYTASEKLGLSLAGIAIICKPLGTSSMQTCLEDPHFMTA